MGEIKLRHIAIVFLPRSPIPFSHEFLVNKKIIPESSDFQVRQGTFSAPPISQIRL